MNYGEFHARVVEDFSSDWIADTVRIPIWARGANGYWLVYDGQRVHTHEVGTELKPEDYITLPKQAIPALLDAIIEWQGKANHGKTEVAVLREWLTVEQRRVDDALGGHR